MINYFDGEFDFLSNFYPSMITDGEIWFPTVEHYYQAAKAKNKEDYKAIAAAPTPGKAKKLGREAEMRTDWEEVKDDIMLEALRQKFNHKLLKEKLLATGEEGLEEGNYWHDNIWGKCYCVECQNTVGQNKLGKMLMKIREEIKSSI